MKFFSKIIIGLTLLLIGLAFGVLIGFKLYYSDNSFINPLIGVKDQGDIIKPLEKYQIKNLKHFPVVRSEVVIEEEISGFEQYTSYLFSYQATGGKVTGQLNIPNNIDDSSKVIVLARGYVSPDIYETGVGTKSAAGVFAQNGYITLAPDFLGYGKSNPEPENSWETRFIKQVNFYELIESVKNTDLKYALCSYLQSISEGSYDECKEGSVNYKIGLWGHSNGGQVILTTLEGFEVSYPTTLWAPVTAPFPYSILYFSDEYQDEGKATRAWLAKFEKEYDVYQFSITKNLDLLNGNIQIQHGTADTSALHDWSVEFLEKVKLENEERKEFNALIEEASQAAGLSKKELINIDLITYEGADHNMRPVWNTVIKRDLDFFSKELD